MIWIKARTGAAAFTLPSRQGAAGMALRFALAVFLPALLAGQLVWAQSGTGERAVCLHGYKLIAGGQAKPIFEACLKLAERGDRRAQGAVAEMYGDGLGTGQDTAKAIYWETQAANQGDILSMYFLGVALSDPTVTHPPPHDLVQAYVWLSLAVATADTFERKIRELDEPQRAEIPGMADAQRQAIKAALSAEDAAEAERRIALWLKEHS